MRALRKWVLELLFCFSVLGVWCLALYAMRNRQRYLCIGGTSDIHNLLFFVYLKMGLSGFGAPAWLAIAQLHSAKNTRNSCKYVTWVSAKCRVPTIIAFVCHCRPVSCEDSRTSLAYTYTPNIRKAGIRRAIIRNSSLDLIVISIAACSWTLAVD